MRYKQQQDSECSACFRPFTKDTSVHAFTEPCDMSQRRLPLGSAVKYSLYFPSLA